MDIISIKLMRSWQGVIANCLLFAQRGYGQNIPLWSVVTDREVMSQEMFTRVSAGTYVHKREHFPVDPHLKYVHLCADYNGGAGRMFVELTMLDFKKLAAECVPSRNGFELKGKQVRFEGKEFLATITCQYFGKGSNQQRRPRTQISTVEPLSRINVEVTSNFFDLLWGRNICCAEWQPKLSDPQVSKELIPASTQFAGVPRQEIRQNLSPQQVQIFQQCFKQDQRPLMTTQTAQTLRLTALRAQPSQVLKLGGEAL